MNKQECSCFLTLIVAFSKHLCRPVNFFNDSYASALIRGVKSNRDNVAMTLHKSSIKISQSEGEATNQKPLCSWEKVEYFRGS